MILLLSPLTNDPLETTVSILFFLEIEIFTTKIVNSKSLKKICRQLLSTMNVLKTDRYLSNFQEHLYGMLRLRKYQTSLQNFFPT